MSLLQQAVNSITANPARYEKPVISSKIEESVEDRIFKEAVSKVLGEDASTDKSDPSKTFDMSSENKGHFGGRQITFKQDVYRLPEKPAGDHTQPVGLLTQSDLQNYVLFRKSDRLNFQYVSGTAGQCSYEYKKNGTDEYSSEIPFSDAVIQELIDDGACDLS
jgi:hypothetical protein